MLERALMKHEDVREEDTGQQGNRNVTHPIRSPSFPSRYGSAQ